MNLGKIYIIVLIAFLFILGCEDDSPLNLDKCSYCDDIADITYLNGSFYTTNYDLSGNAGSQIDLFKYALYPSLDSTYFFIDDTFDLGTIYEYKVAFQGRAINSLSAVVQKYIPNPAGIADVIWVPISSDIIYLNWDIYTFFFLLICSNLN